MTNKQYKKPQFQIIVDELVMQEIERLRKENEYLRKRNDELLDEVCTKSYKIEDLERRPSR